MPTTGTDTDTGAAALQTQAAVLPALGGLPALPLLQPVDGQTAEQAAMPAFPSAITVPEINVQREETQAATKTWETKLAPSIIPPRTRFNYRRALLPAAIYRREYSKSNRHLPRRMTREDYEEMLFASVVKNDVETTRALLNAGTGLQVTTTSGETPLALARHTGAEDVAALLAARGAVE